MKYEKWAIITGGTSGIGLAIAKALALKKVKIIIIGSTQKSINKALLEINPFTECTGIRLDLRRINKIETIIQKNLNHLPKIDYVFNCAGLASFGPIENLNYKIIRDIYYVNTLAPLVLIIATLPWLKFSTKAVIVNISSDQSVINTRFNAVYGSSKCAINHYTRSLNLELQEYKIKVFTFASGPVKTKMLIQALNDLNIKQIPLEAVSPEGLASFILQYINSKKEKDLIFTNKELINE